MLEQLVKSNRSYRRFIESELIELDTLKSLVDLGRCSASAANLQPLKYILVNTPERNALVFPTLAWAGYLRDWDGPTKGERPSAYIIILGDTQISKNVHWDDGIAAQTILLGACEKGLGGCIIGSIDRDLLRRSLKISAYFDILLVIALGKPSETVVLEDVGPDGSIEYFRDASGVHHVPKRRLNDIIVE